MINSEVTHPFNFLLILIFYNSFFFPTTMHKIHMNFIAVVKKQLRFFTYSPIKYNTRIFNLVL